jgi:hypothetical protein
MTCQVLSLAGQPCGKPASYALDAICPHEHVEAGVPACVPCLLKIAGGYGRCSPCKVRGYEGVRTRLVQAKPLSSASSSPARAPGEMKD